jgi:hypothetical protein
MRLPNELTPEQHCAIVEAIRIFASRGRQLRLEREARERAMQVHNGTPAEPLLGGAGKSRKAADRNESDAGGYIDPS